MQLSLIGIGTGNPNHVTSEGIKVLSDADLILIPNKGGNKKELVDLRMQVCQLLLNSNIPPLVEFDIPKRLDKDDYGQSVNDWHLQISSVWVQTIKKFEGKKDKIVLMIWGDPCLYDSSIRIAKTFLADQDIMVVPGITAIQALAAAHKITLTEIGEPLVISTGRILRSEGFPTCVNSAIFMLDGECSFKYLNTHLYDIYWGAYLGMEQEILLSGQLSELSANIISTRENARKKYGWVMDTYLLRKRA
ncbi:MAG: precorrin-6A synthase (deacetylating) [Pseudomonadota bacterium]|nr:precorrin-6A synthase (deacetylating) [Pseudomonadota bacterium]